MNQPIPIVEDEGLDEEARRRSDQLNALFDKLEGDQLDFLDQAGKRVIELSTLMLGLLFGIVAFGDKYPPAYLKGSPLNQLLLLGALALYLLALAAGVMAVQPRRYRRPTYNVTALRAELDKIIGYKRGWFTAGTWLLAGASLALAALVALIVVGA